MKDQKSKYSYEKSVLITCAIEEIFEFHLDTNNLPLVSPPFPQASIKRISDIPLKKNSEVTVSLNFIITKTEWQIIVKEVIPNKLIEDFQKKGIFEYWCHSHIFDVKGDNVLMTDRIDFIPPFGLLGRFLLPFIKFQLMLMFRYRHKKTKMIFER